MKTVHNDSEFRRMFDQNGVPKEPFEVAEGVWLLDLEEVTSLAGVVLAEDTLLSGLKNVTSLEGVTLTSDVHLSGLSNVTSLEGLVLASNVHLSGLNSVTVIKDVVFATGVELHDLPDNFVIDVKPSKAEIDILKRIPLNNLDMYMDHGISKCGTTFCIAGWVYYNIEPRAHKDERENVVHHLPTIAPYLFTSTNTMVRFLTDIQQGDQ